MVLTEEEVANSDKMKFLHMISLISGVITIGGALIKFTYGPGIDLLANMQAYEWPAFFRFVAFGTLIPVAMYFLSLTWVISFKRSFLGFLFSGLFFLSKAWLFTAFINAFVHRFEIIILSGIAIVHGVTIFTLLKKRTDIIEGEGESKTFFIAVTVSIAVYILLPKLSEIFHIRYPMPEEKRIERITRFQEFCTPDTVYRFKADYNLTGHINIQTLKYNEHGAIIAGVGRNTKAYKYTIYPQYIVVVPYNNGAFDASSINKIFNGRLYIKIDNNDEFYFVGADYVKRVFISLE
jgi:hypothetical protein